MEELRNLQQMASAAANRFEQYDRRDFVLPRLFKEQVTEINSNTVVYNEYSAVIESRGNQCIFMPNQWFYIASYFTDLYNELQRYRDYALSVFSKERLKNLNGVELSEREKEQIDHLLLNDTSKEYLVKFVTDYSWWGGAKTIDRNDFYVSPVLAHAQLVNASQSFVAELCAFLADKQDLVSLIISSEENMAVDCNKKTINSSRQIIFYGAPGTGKSHKIKERLESESVPKENIFRTTFHPDSDYSTFVGAYKPTRGKKPLYGLNGSNTVRLHNNGEDLTEEVITYKFVPQAFLKAYIRAYEKPTENVYLIIEEINRGNCAQIFGDLFQLLDRDKDGMSDYTIKADDDLKDYLEDEFKRLGVSNDGIADGELCLPSNLFIYATMNTSDQSLFPIDSAFKRRWDWEYEPIKYNHDLKIKIGNEVYKWTSFQKIVNGKIKDATSSEDKMLGDYFVNPGDGVIDENTLRNKILFYLWNDVCKDGEGDIFKASETEDISFSELYGDKGRFMLNQMMNYLKVEKYADSSEDEDDEDDEENNEEKTKESKHKRLISVTLDGVNYPITTTKFDLYLDIIKKIGIDKVGPLVERSQYHRQNCPLISKTQYSEIVNSKYSYIQVGQYYVIKGINDDTKVNILEFIKEQLNLNMDIEIGM